MLYNTSLSFAAMMTMRTAGVATAVLLIAAIASERAVSEPFSETNACATRWASLNQEQLRPRRFGDTDQMTERLNRLILSGEKTVTATSPWLYEAHPEQTPVFGAYSVMLDAQGQAIALLETIEVKTLAFDAVTAADSQYEGESVRPIDVWQRVHKAYFERKLSPLNRRWAVDMPVTLERFRVQCQVAE